MYMLRALELAVPVLREVVASGLLGADEWNDRLALDSAEAALARLDVNGRRQRHAAS